MRVRIKNTTSFDLIPENDADIAILKNINQGYMRIEFYSPIVDDNSEESLKKQISNSEASFSYSSLKDIADEYDLKCNHETENKG